VAVEDRGYTYDTAWNLNYRTNNGSLSTFLVDSKNELTNAFGNPDSYDGNGNLVAANGSHNEYVYDDENQLIQWFNYQLSSISRSTGDKRTDFVYDGLGRLRVRVEYVLACQVSTNGGGGGDSLVGGGAQTQSQQDNCTWYITNEVHYVYDGMRVIQERNGSNTPTCAYTRGTDLSGSLEGAGGIGGLLARTKYVAGSPTSFALYYSDGNGNVTSLIDTNQTVLASYRYDPFGNIISKSGSLADVNVYRFSSKEVHVNSGMYYYGYRFYDPNLQRWINRDPIGEIGGVNLYRLAENDPADLFDPVGQTVFITCHRVYNTPFYHTTVLMVPDNPADFANDSRFRFGPDGQLYSTLGPERKSGKLVSNLLRPPDAPCPYNKSLGIVLPKDSKESDTDFICSLLAADENYQDNLRYGPFPKPGSNRYNSNSYIAGLLNAAGGDLPPVMPNNMPGFDNPVPSQCFQP